MTLNQIQNEERSFQYRRTVLEMNEKYSPVNAPVRTKHRRLPPNGTWFTLKVAGTLRVPSAIFATHDGYGTWKVPATF
jgi:hypothetical protein